jgi:hypothetical protein
VVLVPAAWRAPEKDLGQATWMAADLQATMRATLFETHSLEIRNSNYTRLRELSTPSDGTRPLRLTGTAFHKIFCRAGYNCAPENRFSIDRILVVDQLPPAPVEPMTWGGIKALFRSE